jgi:mRNA-degrading endonuclease RelE of RelBE toxin-antitoxin system
MFSILYVREAEWDLRAFRSFEQRRILDEVDRHLAANPTRGSRRKKMLRGIEPPWHACEPVWQLRIGDFRVFYDVNEERREVTVRAVRRKGGQTTKEIP